MYLDPIREFHLLQGRDTWDSSRAVTRHGVLSCGGQVAVRGAGGLKLSDQRGSEKRGVEGGGGSGYIWRQNLYIQELIRVFNSSVV